MIDYNLLVIQNSWWQNKNQIKNDPKIIEFASSKIKFNPSEILNLRLKNGAINILFGPRQTGKSTAIKLLIKKLLEKKEDPENIFYFNCDALENKQSLIDLVLVFQQSLKSSKKQHYIFLDEISSVDDWPLAIKWLVDVGKLSHSKIILTGSSSINLKKSGEYLPGRRGGGVDLKLLPINFLTYTQLIKKNIDTITPAKSFSELQQLSLQFQKNKINLEKLLQDFFKTGGFLKAIDVYLKNQPLAEVIDLYKSGLKSELAKSGKKELHARSVIRKIIDSLSAQTSYANIAEEAELGSKNTAADYLHLLTDSFLLSEVFHFNIDQKRVVIKKNKKYYPIDTLLLWVFQSFITGGNQPEIFYQKYKYNPLAGQLIESFIASELYKQHKEFYYSGNNRELDFYIPSLELGIEVKYKDIITSNDLQQLNKIKHKILISKKTLEQRGDITIVPAFLFSFLDLKSFCKT